MLEEFLLTPNQYGNLLEGTWVTVQVIIGAFVLGTVMSLIMGVARLSHRRWLRGWALVYIEFARGISAIILLFIMFFAIPILLGMGGMSPMAAGILALGLNMGAYGAEVVRGAIQSVPRGQTEASIALNLTEQQRLRHVVLPQAIPIILPPYGNLTIEVLKGTALVALISLTDITRVMLVMRQNRVLSDDPLNVPFLFLNGLIIYLILSQIIAQLFKVAERRTAKKFGST